MKTVLVVLALSAMSFAQDAIVQQLTPVEAKQAKQLYDAKQAADKAWDELNDSLGKKYEGQFPGHAIKFSKDFRFLVPDAPKFATSGPWINGSCLTYNTAPLTGNITTDNSVILKGDQ